jgi:putative serine protease PepD
MDNIPALPSLLKANGQEVPIDQPVIIGRQPGCTIQIDDPRASRQHARIESTQSGVVITDLGSNNGTYVNEKKLTAPAYLKNGDRIRIGGTVFAFKAAPAPRAVPAAPVVLPSPEAATKIEPEQPPQEVKEGGGTELWQNTTPMALVRGDGAEFGLNKDIKIGRGKDNDIALEKDTSASTAHTGLQLVNGEVIITDLKSRNGTWVNGKRLTAPVILKHGDRIRIGNTLFRLRVGDQRLPPLDAAAVQAAQPPKGLWKTSAGVALGVSLIVIVCVGIIALGFTLGKPLFIKATPTLSPGAQETHVYEAKQNALRAMVLIYVPLAEEGWASTGSGSLLNDEGYVLTNNHVIAENIGEIYIGLNWADPTAEPDTFYYCEIVKTSPELDLAILHVVATSQGDSLPSDLVFPYLPIGNSDNVKIGDQVTIIGYPGIGGTTPTMTAGTVSGFSPDEYNGIEKGWIKTDTLISWGNSGGMAINLEGELIGVPTQFTEESMEDKPLDTFLGELRPINIAMQYIGNDVRIP